MSRPALDPSFEQALAAEIVASEEIRVRVLAATLGVLLVLGQVIFLVFVPRVPHLLRRPVPPWMPLLVIGAFALYETVALLALRRWRRTGRPLPTPVRFGNATVETSLPTVILWTLSHYLDPETVFGTWPLMVYFVFIVAATLCLDFILPLYTSLVASAGYLAVVGLHLPLSDSADSLVRLPVEHLARAVTMVMAGVVAGLVALRLRQKFHRAVEEAAARERVTNLFGQHVSPAVVERLLHQQADGSGETREICVMFLDIRNFTSQARQRRPPEVVAFLNDVFAFMIEAVDRHGGFINKFLGDGFMAVFGAPLDDPRAAHHAVAAARDILEEIEGRGLAGGPWPLRVGIGLHAGPAVIGNVGSPRRKEFTAIGDTVNLASRLEQLNKTVGSQLLVSDTVAEALQPVPDPTALVGDLAVKGYEQTVRVWRLG